MTFLEQILLTIVTAFATAILAYFGFWRQAKAELQKEYETKFNEKKWETYVKFVIICKERMEIASTKLFYEFQNENVHALVTMPDNTVVDKYPGDKKRVVEFEKKLKEIQGEFLLISSSKVIEKFSDWYNIFSSLTKEENMREDETFLILINAMREDLGKKGDSLV